MPTLRALALPLVVALVLAGPAGGQALLPRVMVVSDVGPVFFESVAYAGGHLVLAGGHHPGGVSSDDVRRFLPDGTEVPTGATLPTPRYDMATATDGRHVYLFGGWDGTILDDVLRYDPVLDQLTVLDARLPTPVYSADAAFDGRYVYVVGGSAGLGGAGGIRNVYRFDPQTETFTDLGPILPTARSGSAVLFDGRHLVVMGGCDNGCRTTFADVWRYDVQTGAASVTGTLPFGRGGTATTFDGARGFVFGGATYTGVFTDQILVYDPLTGTVAVDAAKLPGPRGDGEAAQVGALSYYVGGNTGSGITGEVVVRVG